MSNFNLLSFRNRRPRSNLNLVFNNQSQRVTQTTNVPKSIKKQENEKLLKEKLEEKKLAEKKLLEKKLLEKKNTSIVWKRINGKTKIEKRREREARAAAEKRNIEKRIENLKKENSKPERPVSEKKMNIKKRIKELKKKNIQK